MVFLLAGCGPRGTSVPAAPSTDHDIDPEPMPAKRSDDPRKQGGRRKYPIVQVGDTFGNLLEVVALAVNDATCNERVEVKCLKCGKRRVAYVFNLRARASCVCQKRKRPYSHGTGTAPPWTKGAP